MSLEISTERRKTDCLMIKLEGESAKDFNHDAAILHQFDIIIRGPGGSQSIEKIKQSKEAATYRGWYQLRS